MNIILLSGGSGRRLWPLSNEIRSKQFLKLFKTADGYESMLQRVCRQMRTADPEADITIATAEAQVPLIREQIGEEVSLCVEPCRRDTFPTIALATAYLHDVKDIGMEEAAVVCPVDPYVDGSYFEAVGQLGQMAGEENGNLFLMGISPAYPSEKYGYIIPESHGKVSRVLEFKEKPDRKTAEKYIAQGGLWNGGVFAYRLSYVLGRAEELLGYSDYDGLFSHYEELKKISFDYAVVEQEPDISVLRFDGQWRDVGTWDMLTEVLDGNEVGNSSMSGCGNVHVLNELDIPILAVGLHDVVIAASADGILVADKKASDQIKLLVD